MGGKGGTTIQQPDQIDPGASMGEYLFGKGFSDYQGVTDPRLQERLIGAEQRFRPQYAALELADINTFAQGIAGGKDNPQYKRLEAQLAGLEAGEGGISGAEATKIAQSAAGPIPSKTLSERYRSGKSGYKTREVKNPNYEKELAEYNREVQSLASSLGGNRASQIASVKAEMAQLESSPGQGGLFDLLEEQSTRAGALQREQLQLQRESDVGALQEFAPQVVEAYRDADPYSTEIAESMSRKAMGQLTPEEQRGIDQRARQGSLARGRIGDQSSLAAEALGRSDYTAQFAQPAFAMNRQLAGDVGMTILGRPSSSIGLGSQMLGQAQQGAAGPMGPQLFDPNVGINMAMQQQSNQVSLLGAQAQADAARSAGRSSMIGSVLGGAAIGLCWVAREVYGIENPQWLEFREWMLNDAPSWLRNLYLKYGERFAKFISNKPRVKSIIRKWMNTKIK
jgi:hypothetical protein